MQFPSSRPAGLRVLAATLALLAGCAATGPETCDCADEPGADRVGVERDDFEEIVSRDGRMAIRWRPAEGFVPVNEEFELEVEVRRTGVDGTGERPVTGALVHLSGTMPAHGHGMVREPRSEELGDGRYRIPGALLHMPGHWEMVLTVVAADIAYSADFVLDL